MGGSSRGQLVRVEWKFSRIRTPMARIRVRHVFATGAEFYEEAANDDHQPWREWLEAHTTGVQVEAGWHARHEKSAAHKDMRRALQQAQLCGRLAPLRSIQWIDAFAPSLCRRPPRISMRTRPH